MKQNLFVLTLLPLLLFACGKSDEQSGAGATQTVAQSGTVPFPGYTNPTYPNTGNYPTINGQYGYYFVQYEFREGGCTTGLRRFSGNEYEGVRRNLCDGLRNEWMNYRCSPSQRQAYFSVMCQ